MKYYFSLGNVKSSVILHVSMAVYFNSDWAIMQEQSTKNGDLGIKVI